MRFNILKNKTFKNGNNFQLNACVGNNTATDNRYSYMLGFSQAVTALVSSIKEQNPFEYELKNNFSPFLDTIIYPIGFCARHHIELFIKNHIEKISYIKAHKNYNFESGSEHDLDILWKKLLMLCSEKDSRLYHYAKPIEQYVYDFHNIDETGQTFRYPFDLKSRMHLEDISIINLEVFIKRYEEACSLMEEFYIHTDVIIREYRLGTYTSKLSRFELSILADLLPPRDQWAENPRFDEIKREYAELKGISSNDFCKAINKITKNRELARKINIELPLEEFTMDTLNKINDIILTRKGKGALTELECRAISGIIEVSDKFSYVEAYDYEIIRLIPEGEYAADLEPGYLIRKINQNPLKFSIGLEKLNQITLLAKFREFSSGWEILKDYCDFL